MEPLPTTRMRWLLITAVVLTLAVGVYAILANNAHEQELAQAQQTLSETQQQLTQAANQLENLREQNEALQADLKEAENRNQEFEDQIAEITDTVGSISRYTSVDPELLKKYSRVFFLSENYTPSGLTRIDREYVHERGVERFHEKAYPFLQEMIEAAEDDDIELRVISAFRSFDEQQNINDRYTITYGAGTANQFSAEQGYSEHQLGTTVDFTTPELGANFEQFANTEAYQWLLDNAHRYGFVLSYPKNNAYYIFEPWHWRFVGVELAQDLEDEDEHFYDWDQREIDEYRGKIFQD